MTATYERSACPVCGPGGSIAVAGAEGIRGEMEALWGFHLRRLRPGVPTRELTDRVIFSREPPLGVRGCGRCGTLFRAPGRRGDELERLYAREPVDADTLAELREALRPAARRQARRLTRLHGGAGRVLEVGSYAGSFLEEARRLGWQARGLEVSGSALSFLRAEGLAVEEATIEEAARDGGPGSLDAVVLWNCFDQLSDPGEAARAARALLRTGGLLGVRVPNGALYRRLRGGDELKPPTGAALPLLAWNNLLGFPYRTGFTPGSLGLLLEERGFRMVEVRGDVLGRLADGWSRGWAELEERLVKGAGRAVARWRPAAAPWLEAWARAA